MERAFFEQYRDLIKECGDLEERIRDTQKKLERAELVKDKVKGGAGGGVPFTVEGINDRAYSGNKTTLQMSMMRLYEHRMQQYKMLDEVETYIAAVPDSERRMIMRYYYQDGRTWSEVARILGEGYTEDAIRISMERFWKKEEKKNHDMQKCSFCSVFL